MFNLGKIVLTRGAADLFLSKNASFLACLNRHASGDWGDLCEEDKEANNSAITAPDRILSSYDIGGKKLWIITEADRSCTTLLLPEEY